MPFGLAAQLLVIAAAGLIAVSRARTLSHALRVLLLALCGLVAAAAACYLAAVFLLLGGIS